MRAVLVIAVLAGCVPFAPREVVRDASPEELVARVRDAARDERWGDLYDHLGEGLRKKWSRLEFRIGFPTQVLPPPHGYRLADVVARGSEDGMMPDPQNPDRAIVFYSYREAGKPRFEAQVLIARQRGSWRIEGLE
jgi:hypothetical protein